MLVAHVSGPRRLQPELCPNSLRRCCFISKETGDWLVCDPIPIRYNSNVCSIWDEEYCVGLSTIGQKQQDVVSTLLSHSMCHVGAPEEYKHGKV